MKFEVEIQDDVLEHFSQWQRVYGIKVVVIDGKLDVLIARDAAEMAAAIRRDRTPKVAAQPVEPGNIRWR